MPRVEIPQSRRVIPTGTGITQAPDLTAPTREAQRTGAIVTGIAAEGIQKEKTRRDVTYVANASVQAERQIEDLKKELRSDMQAPEEHANTFFELSSDVYNSYAENAPSQEAQLSLQQQFASLQRGRLREETAYQDSAIKARDLKAYEESSLVLENELFENPESLEKVLAQQGQLDASLKGVVAPQQLANISEHRKKTLAVSYVKGLIQRDPHEALEILGSDSLDSTLSASEQLSLESSANTKIKRDRAEAQAQFNKSQRKFVDSIKLQIVTGTMDQGGIDQMLEAGSLTPQEYNSLSRMQNQQLKKEADKVFSNSFIGESLRRNIPLNPSDKKTKEAVDSYYKEIIIPQMEGVEREEAVMAELSFINDVGIVPKTIIDQVSASIATGSSEVKADAAKFITSLGFSNPRLSNAFSKTDLAMAEKISTNVNSMSVEDAVKAAEVAVLEKKTEQYKTKLSRFNADRPEFDDARFTDSFFEFFDGLPDTVPPGMEDQFVDLIKSYNVDLEVPLDTAEKLAYQTLLKEWTVTDINGTEEYMRFAPEAVYGSPEMGSEWIKDQLRKDVGTIRGKEIDEDEDFLFSPVPTTFGSSGGVKYYIYQIDPTTGFEEVIKDTQGVPMLWFPSEQEEVTRLTEEAEQRKESIQQEKIGRAEANIKGQQIEENIQSIREGF